MNLGTFGAILGAISSFLVIIAWFDSRIKNNQARLRAEKGRVVSLSKIIEIQGKRIEAIEMHLSLSTKEDENFAINNPLIALEEEAKAEYKKHHTNLT